ncbi:hypothetical protein EWM64_g3328 [Hericium alpestre]|uniref:Ubiquitin carboxyl-terminal hydrolase n=1 Tax=Hericium alpestre TaxID=135208 RepID=A0A4Z0A477_9AGAM|nr:hypothetical protein EWM64_g3328 [Hericium alpestre]
MAPLNVHIKHAGKVYDVLLDTDLLPSQFKQNIYQQTGVPPERMKVMVKGGVLKDDADWKKIGPKEGQTFMVIGAAGELPKPPEKPTVFLEDMDDAELAKAIALPVGLANLGNTCYMNATVQAMGAIPELKVALNRSNLHQPLLRSLRDLYKNMAGTTQRVLPLAFLEFLRQAVPQFNERSTGPKIGNMDFGGYAQQGKLFYAEECWTAITNALKAVPGFPNPDGSEPANFVKQYMTGRMRRELKTEEAPEEPPTVSTEDVLQIECNISGTTNYMSTGIMEALDQKVEKTSPTLGRQAVYTQSSRLERLPQYLSVHMVRFTWKQDINAKAKILRKVKFPIEFDAVDLATPGLREKLTPANRRLREIEKDRAERRKVFRRAKRSYEDRATERRQQEQRGAEERMETDAEPNAEAGASEDAATQGERLLGESVTTETEKRENERKELIALVDPHIRDDTGASETGLYDLVAIITHKGAAADSGHYMAYVKKSVFKNQGIKGAPAPSTAGTSSQPAEEVEDWFKEDEDWYKFDDDKVTEFPVEKLATLDGGGEDSSAYVLLYRSKQLA